MAQIQRDDYERIRANLYGEDFGWERGAPGVAAESSRRQSARGRLAAILRIGDVSVPVRVAIVVLCVAAVALGALVRAEAAGTLVTGDGPVADIMGTARQAMPTGSADNASSLATAPASTAHDATAQASQSDRGSSMLVDVDGAVRVPGVYPLAAGARVTDAIAAAGGLAEDADTAAINQAARLSDGMKLTVPSVAAPTTGGVSSGVTVTPDAGDGTGRQTASAPVNINTATAEELQTLTGVGPSTAQEIISERERGGPFASKEDLMRVSGIGERKYAKLEQDICV